MDNDKETSTLKQTPEGEINLASILAAIQNLDNKFDSKFEHLETKMDSEFEKIRLEFVSVDARFDRLEAITLDAKSTALMAKSQLTIMTEEVRAWSKEVIQLRSLV